MEEQGRTAQVILFDPHKEPWEAGAYGGSHVLKAPSGAGFEPGFVPVSPTRGIRASFYILTLVQEAQDTWTGLPDSLLMSTSRQGPGETQHTLEMKQPPPPTPSPKSEEETNFLWSLLQSSLPPKTVVHLQGACTPSGKRLRTFERVGMCALQHTQLSPSQLPFCLSCSDPEDSPGCRATPGPSDVAEGSRGSWRRCSLVPSTGKPFL